MPEFSTETATTVSIAQSLLVAEKDKGPITAALISEKVKIAASVVAPGNEQSIDTSAAIAELIRRFSMWIGSWSSSGLPSAPICCSPVSTEAFSAAKLGVVNVGRLVPNSTFGP